MLTLSLGIAHFFGAILPARFGVLSEEKCVTEMNSILRRYYTSPYRSEKEIDVIDDWTNVLKINIPYDRGFTFHLKMDGLLRRATAGKASLDDVALDLIKRRRSGQHAGQKEWICSLGRFTDEESVAQALNEMLEGGIVIPTTSSLPGYTIHRCDKEPFELGFAFESLASHKIVDVVPGSRAAAAGVQNGDKILSSTRVGNVFYDFHSQMELEVQRGDRSIDIQYWPRAKLKAPCWEFRPTDASS
jgi:predicted metalloprotease with PDZ domain